ncbi:hypothetical protein K7X08_025768 [Anisodus acutangulus]|uniref:Uncharacterized protein n=1 Tax=Anisodus acutangulus TaxID=402998 RepID=A0A9Q1LAK1_9SOLA|nr:hypothetical protein K7X08_025768 [Anisodus acutangulus]
MVVTTQDNEKENSQDIMVPSNPPIKLHNTFQSKAEITGQFEDNEEDQEQDTETTISEDVVRGKDQLKIMNKDQQNDNSTRESPEVSTTDSSPSNHTINDEDQSQGNKEEDHE